MDYTKLLETYTLEELLEYNDLEIEEVLEFLVEYYTLRFPPIPVDA
jgi:hypothetical protein